MTHDLRAMCDAVAYVVKNGIEWRALPVDFLSVTWNQTSQDPSRILRRHRELRRPVGHEGAGGEVAGSGPA
jgi:transposase